MSIPLISLEEHFYSHAVYNALDERGRQVFEHNPGYLKSLEDIDGERLTSMDQNGVTCQVISHAWQTGGAGPDVCKAGNDELANRIRDRHDRFAAFAVLPMGDPRASAIELERCVKQLGFVGALVDNHVDGKYFDGPEYDVLWQRASDLDVPVYIHPTLTSASAIEERYSGNYPAGSAFSLAHESWGWHSDTGLHVLRLVSAGVFDRNPNLKVIVGHFGEMLPFMLERCEGFGYRWNASQRSLIDVWEQNIYVTTSGVWSLNPMRCLLANTKIEHILYSVDWPFTTNEEGRRWFEELASSGLLNPEQLELVAFRNAETLLRLGARKARQ
ncbi:hypothetical protein AMS68_005325 [Peltaster fructicola]|uniref:Amidohydrolase-related domain-containing protein n=1 Tax=Peltaster fructicola TaxID=286661 RepID=A0A6H0XYY4_9PEZI|nr:hypothetical protein AMS68_005325 [Peltaster fructicola]